MHEDRSTRVAGVMHSIRATPGAVLDGVRLLWRSRVLRALVAAELFWGFGMIAFELFMPIRLSELLTDRDRAAAIMGPVTAAAWGVSALGAAMVPLLLRRWSMVGVSVTLRIVQGATVVGMGLAAGPVGLILGLFATYAVHSAAGAIYETLLHEQVGKENRATVLSLASMAMQPAGSIGAITLGMIATGVSTDRDHRRRGRAAGGAAVPRTRAGQRGGGRSSRRRSVRWALRNRLSRIPRAPAAMRM